jgi:hypothetical protein
LIWNEKRGDYFGVCELAANKSFPSLFSKRHMVGREFFGSFRGNVNYDLVFGRAFSNGNEFSVKKNMFSRWLKGGFSDDL